MFGSFRTAYRTNIGTDLDISNENFTEYVNGLTNLTFFRNNLLYISGHEKNQQIIRKGNNYLINSGAPTSSKFADWETDALLSEKTAGIIELMFFSNGLVKARLLGFKNSQEFVENNEIVLYKSGCDTTIKDDKDVPTNLSYVPCRPPVKATTRMSENYSKTIKVTAGNEYEASELKEFWLGGHYRDSWVQSVEVSYLDLDTSFGGLFIYKKGGGRQTTSLKFKTPNGSEYVFRSVNKDPAKSLNYRLRPTFAATMIRDQTSTQQPYGALAVDILLDELDILHAHPKLYVLPDDAKLGPFRDKYANLLGMLEEKPGKPNDEGVRFGNADKILKSQQLFRLMYEDIDNKVLSNEFIRARIFDIWVGDWSKHEDNWKWAGYSQNDGMIFRPIPRDRDHVFSRWDGVLPWLADREWASKNGENFDYKIKGLNSLVHQATNLDRLLTVEATKEDWLREAKFIQQNITDEIIDKAINNMPPEIYNLSGIEIASKLKARLNDLDQYATEHYLMLSKEVDIVGSVKNELFNVLRNDNGTVTVSMFKQFRDSLGNPDLQLRFYRVFLPDETKEIRLYGLRGDDSFNIDGSSGKSIKIRIIGGAGDDAIIDRSDVSSLNKKTLIYDKGKSSFIVTGKEAKVIKYWNREIYKYDRNRFEYNSYTPRFLLGYNTFNGFSVKVGANFSRRNFTKEDYSSKHKFILGFSSEGNRSFIYQSKIHDLIRKWDLIISGSVAQPEFYNYFFGVGNKTIKEDSIYGLNYHKAKYNCYQFSLGFVRDFWKESNFSIKFGIENNKVEKLKNTILYDSVSIYGVSKALTIIPVEATLDLDFRDG